MSLTLDLPPLRLIGWPLAATDTPDPSWRALFERHQQALPARVVEQHRSGYVVASGPEEQDTMRPESLPEWQRPRFPAHERPAVGDWVLVEEGKRIVAVLPRRTAIKRAAAGDHYHQQVIAANVDTAFIVCGLDADFNPRRIERYLMLVGGGGVQPVVVLTKMDRTDYTDDALEVLADLAAQQIPVRPVNGKDPVSVAALHEWLGPGRTVVLVGSSGAGKSTLTNTLLGIEKMKTSAVRESDSRGRHTTTHRALIPLPSGACLIDTPGMRELKPTGEEDLAEGGFADIEALASQCRFRDCAHQGEPGCAVEASIDRGELDPARLANYMKLQQEVSMAAAKLAKRVAENTGKGPGRRPAGRPGRR